MAFPAQARLLRDFHNHDRESIQDYSTLQTFRGKLEKLKLLVGQ